MRGEAELTCAWAVTCNQNIETVRFRRVAARLRRVLSGLPLHQVIEGLGTRLRFSVFTPEVSKPIQQKPAWEPV